MADACPCGVQARRTTESRQEAMQPTHYGMQTRCLVACALLAGQAMIVHFREPIPCARLICGTSAHSQTHPLRRQCPWGIDPLTPGQPQAQEVQTIACPGTLASYQVSFSGFRTAVLPATADGASVQAALLALPSISSVEVAVVGSPCTSLAVTFGNFHGDAPQLHMFAVLSSGAGLSVEATEHTKGAAYSTLRQTMTCGLESSAGSFRLFVGSPTGASWTPFLSPMDSPADLLAAVNSVS